MVIWELEKNGEEGRVEKWGQGRFEWSKRKRLWKEEKKS